MLILIMFASIEISVFLISPDIAGYLDIPYFLIVIFVHLLVVVATTSIGLSRTMNDEIVEGIRKDYY
jgi:hypothetical protein